MTFLAAALILLTSQDPANLQTAKTEPGLTVWVWDIDGRPDRHPTIAEGQVPNIYTIKKTLDVPW